MEYDPHFLCTDVFYFDGASNVQKAGQILMAAIYAKFMAQSALTNRGRKVCVIRGAGTRMALRFYAMMPLIHLHQALNATIHQQKILDLTLTTSARGAVQDIRMKTFGSACTSYFVPCFLHLELFGNVIQTHLAWTNFSTYHTGPRWQMKIHWMT